MKRRAKTTGRNAAALAALGVLLFGCRDALAAERAGAPYMVVRCGKAVRAALPPPIERDLLPMELDALCRPGACQVAAWPEHVPVPDCDAGMPVLPVALYRRGADGSADLSVDCAVIEPNGAACIGQ